MGAHIHVNTFTCIQKYKINVCILNYVHIRVVVHLRIRTSISATIYIYRFKHVYADIHIITYI